MLLVPLGREVGLGLGNIVLDWTELPRKGGTPPIFGPPFVKRFALCYRSVVSLSVLSVTFVHGGQMVGRIKTKLGVQVGLGPGHIVLDGDPAPAPPKGYSPPIFCPYLLRPNGCMDQDVTWYGARPRPRRLCRTGTTLPLPKTGAGPPKKNFRPMFIAAKRPDG